MTNNVEFRLNGYVPFKEYSLQNYKAYKIKYDSMIDRTSLKLKEPELLSIMAYPQSNENM